MFRHVQRLALLWRVPLRSIVELIHWPALALLERMNQVMCASVHTVVVCIDLNLHQRQILAHFEVCSTTNSSTFSTDKRLILVQFWACRIRPRFSQLGRQSRTQYVHQDRVGVHAQLLNALNLFKAHAQASTEPKASVRLAFD